MQDPPEVTKGTGQDVISYSLNMDGIGTIPIPANVACEHHRTWCSFTYSVNSSDVMFASIIGSIGAQNIMGLGNLCKFVISSDGPGMLSQ